MGYGVSNKTKVLFTDRYIWQKFGLRLMRFVNRQHYNQRLVQSDRLQYWVYSWEGSTFLFIKQFCKPFLEFLQPVLHQYSLKGIIVQTWTILSIRGRAVATALQPTVGTVRPSAMLGVVGVKTGVPAFRALAKLGHLSGSTPWKTRKNGIKLDHQSTSNLSEFIMFFNLCSLTSYCDAETMQLQRGRIPDTAWTVKVGFTYGNLRDIPS